MTCANAQNMTTTLPAPEPAPRGDMDHVAVPAPERIIGTRICRTVQRSPKQRASTRMTAAFDMDNQPSTRFARSLNVPTEVEHKSVHRRVMVTWLPSLRYICTLRVPLIRHIPTRARAHVLRVYTGVVWDAARARHDTARERAYVRLMLFPKCIFLVPSKRVSRRSRISTADIVIQRLEQWSSGSTKSLWDAVMRRHATQQQHAAENSTQQHTNIRRAISFAHEGAFA